jgi:FlgD Ig-like domain
MHAFARDRAAALLEAALVVAIIGTIGAGAGLLLQPTYAATSYTTPEGTLIVMDSPTWAGSADDVYRMLLENGLDSLIGPRLTVRVQDTNPSSTATSVACCTSDGSYYNFRATIWLSGKSTSGFTSRPNYTVGHEFGHAWTLYHLSIDQGGDWARYLEYRGLAGDTRVDSTYVWSKSEMIADDYRLILGSAKAKSEMTGYINAQVPPPSSFPDFAQWFRSTWAAGHIGTILEPTPLKPNASATQAPTAQPTAAPAATPTPTPAPAATATPTAAPTASPTVAPDPTPAPTPEPTPTPAPDPTPAPTPVPVPVDLAISDLSASPQSFKKQTSITYRLTAGASVAAVVLDSKGVVVRNLLDATVYAGGNSVTWNRTDDAGRRVPNGTYVVRIAADDGSGHHASSSLSVTAK